MPESESPQLRRERIAGVVTAALAFLALPTVVLLVHQSAADTAERREAVALFLGCFALGVAVPLLYWSPFRALGFAPLASVVWFAVALLGCFDTGSMGPFPGLVHGIPLGMIVGATVRGRRGPEPGEETTGLFFAVLVGAGFAWGILSHGQQYDLGTYLLLLLSVSLLLWTWARLFRPLFELSLEPVAWVAFKLRARGPGLATFPRTGPCIVFANHACWFDPLFLAKILPRPVTPMMTARFYDLPVMRRLMVAFGVIRVPEKAIKHDAPEVAEAIAALDRGECLVIFPEGYLRRSEEQPLRRFGQGLWQILKARPDTPLFACWIEGAWGSYASYLNGRPTQNKRPDFRRPIAVGVAAATTVPPELLGEHMATRIYLMNLVSAARTCLDLAPLPTFELPERADDRPEATDAQT